MNLPVTVVTAPLPPAGYDTGRESSTAVQRELKKGASYAPFRVRSPTGCGLMGRVQCGTQTDFMQPI